MENHNSFICPICGNTDIHSIEYLNGKPYCRKCIAFRGEEVEHIPSYPKRAPIHLEYELSPEQKELSDKLVENYKKGIDSLVFAVWIPKDTKSIAERRKHERKEIQKHLESILEMATQHIL